MSQRMSYIHHPLIADTANVRRANIALRNMQLHSKLDAMRKRPLSLDQIAKRLPVYDASK